MKARLTFLLRYTLYWLIFFISLKIVFLLFNFNESFKHLSSWGGIFFYGIKLDLSTIGYILILPMLLLLINCILPGKWTFKVIKIYTFFFIALFSILVVCDLGLYREWGFRLDATPLRYLKNPDEAFASTPFGIILLYILLCIALIVPYLYLYKKYIFNLFTDKNISVPAIPTFLLLTGLLIIPIRGGFDTAPISIGSVYFHSQPFVNHAAINLPWNILYSITKLKDMENPFAYDKSLDHKCFIRDFHSTTGKTDVIIHSKQPNILLIILESFTNNAIGVLNDIYDATPNLDSIAKRGLLFTNFYASGSRSDKGLAALLSGYPSMPTTSVMIFPDKTQNLPGLANSLKKVGYNTSFYYGGDINFASMKSFMLNTGFEYIIAKEDFPNNQSISKWGIPDEYLFDRVYKDIQVSDTPYFKTVFTLSSHPPFDIPAEQWLEGNDRETLFLNSIHYTDHHIGNFIRSLEKNKLLNNTLVIFISDHGNSYPGNHLYSSKQKFNIPLIWYGPVLLKKGIFNLYASQTDLPKTLLTQLGLPAADYYFSRNMFADDFRSEAFYAFRNGFGFISDSLNYSYFKEPDKITTLSGQITKRDEIRGKLFYQSLYDDFLSLK